MDTHHSGAIEVGQMTTEAGGSVCDILARLLPLLQAMLMHGRAILALSH